jgi:hypothetical protein
MFENILPYLTNEQRNRLMVVYNEGKLSDRDMNNIISLCSDNSKESIKTIDSIINRYYVQPNRVRLYTDDDYKFNTSSPIADTVFGSGVYFHGQAEEILGHDIICLPHDFSIEPGIHEFEVVDNRHGHQILTGTLYLWDAPNWGLKGLAVADGDYSGNLYAKQCYNEKKKFL